MRPVDVVKVALAAVDVVMPTAHAKRVTLRTNLDPRTPNVMGDQDRLQQVIWNLLSNALKFTDGGGSIEVRVTLNGRFARIVVTDTGHGISPEFLPHVFERFRQADSSTTRLQAGLGLGLAIVRHLVDLHGGTVTATSAGLGKGATFTVTLPTRRSNVVPAPDPLPVDVPNLKGVRVLAVDDDEDSRELVLLTARAAEAEVMVVSSAASALDALSSFRPHVIVADLAMPGMDGYALMQKIGNVLQGPPPPVIAMSAYVGEEELERTRQAGFARHLGKPADYQRLVSTIAELARSK
jgi:CheY-like chemotaxis protein/anti-sigma regulatory factor (Ser/Thr protein kinase)